MGKTIAVGGLIPLLVLSFFLMTAVVYAQGIELKQKTGDYNVTVRLDRNPAVVGDNTMEVQVSDASGRSVTDVKVTVSFSMPAMSGMPAMNYKTTALLTGTKYTAILNLSMSGSWNVAVKIAKAGKSSTVRFNVDAQ